MITIVKGNEEIKCSYKTYENQFKQLGYQIASEKKREANKKATSFLEEKNNEDIIEEKIGLKYGTRKKTTTKKGE